MLFLAVSLGFFVENIREHHVENERAEVLAQSLLEDLKRDTSFLHAAITFSDKKLIALDSILDMMHNPISQLNDTAFYRNMTPVMISIPFISTDGTYSQMKASGSLRYFKQYLVNEMNAYSVQLKRTGYREDVEDKGIWLLADMNFNILNLEVIADIRFNHPITHNLYLRFADKLMIDKFINLALLNKSFRLRSRTEYIEQLKIADKLMENLQKEF